MEVGISCFSQYRIDIKRIKIRYIIKKNATILNRSNTYV